MPTLPAQPPDLPRLIDPDLARLRRLHPDLTDVCPTCRGRLSFRWWSPDEPGVAVDWQCNCTAQRKMQRAFMHCGLGLAYQRLSWDDMTQVTPALMEVVDDYVTHVEGNVQAGQGMILWGPGMGTGKTGCTALLLKRLISMGYDGYFTGFAQMIDLHAAGWRDREDQDWFVRRVTNAGLLVIDDVGRERKQVRVEDGKVAEYGTALAEALFDNVIRTRVASARPTLITTNRSMEEIRHLYAGNVMSLLAEACWDHQVTGGDFRPSAKERRQTELRQGLSRPIVVG